MPRNDEPLVAGGGEGLDSLSNSSTANYKPTAAALPIGRFVRRFRWRDAAPVPGYPWGSSAALLRALAQVFGRERFDAASISGAVDHHPALRRALAFLEVKLRRGNYLSDGSTRRVSAWLDAMARARALTRDRIGWFYLADAAARLNGGKHER